MQTHKYEETVEVKSLSTFYFTNITKYQESLLSEKLKDFLSTLLSHITQVLSRGALGEVTFHC